MSFVNLGTLWGALGLGALAASIPLIIHILNRRRFRIVEWAAMRFLLEAQKQNRRRVLLEQLILLLLRMLLAAILAWLVLRPLLPSEGAGALFGGEVHHIWIVDDSRSLAATSGGVPLANRSRTLLLEFGEFLAESAPGDTMSVLRTSRPASPDLVHLSLAATPAREELAAFSTSFQPGDGRADLAGSLASALQLAGEFPGASSVIYVVGDSCLADWRDTSGGPRADLVEAASAAAEAAELVLVDLAAVGSRENVGVVAVEVAEGNVIATAPISLRITVKNFGTREVRELTPSISSSSVTQALPPIASLPPGASETIQVPFAFREPGSALVTATIPADRFASDDSGQLSVDVLESLDVLVVDGEPGEGTLDGEPDRGSESWFLTRALAPQGPVRSGIRVELASEDRFAGMELGGYAAIVLANVFRIEAAQVEALYAAVSRGTGLVVFPGDQTDAELFERDLFRSGEGLAPAGLGEPRGDPTGDEFTSFSAPPGDHPVTALFAGEDNPFLVPVKLYSWLALTPREGARVLLAAAGDPVLAEDTHGKGRVLVFGLPADDEWSNWPGEPSYLVTVQEAVHHVAARTSASRNVPLGTRVVRPLDPTRFDVKARLQSPAGGRSALQAPISSLVAARVDEHDLALDLGVLDRAGSYSLELDRREGGVQAEHYVVHPSPEEGDLRRADQTALENLLPEVEFRFVDDPGSLLAQAAEAERAELWRQLAMLALALLLLETFLAWRFGHPSRRH